MDIFDEKGIKPMLISEQKKAFDSLDWIYDVKLDGIRCIAYLDFADGTDLRNKRDKKLLPHVPELSDIHKQAKRKCILDGELFILNNGMTDFYEIQRRALMTDPFKIKLSAGKFPATFTAYDIIYDTDHLVMDLPLMERKDLLSDIIMENDRINVSRYIEENGIALFEAAKQQVLEGVVAKRKDSKYYFGKRTKDWIKFKVMETEDCIICGYIKKANNMTSLILGQYDGQRLIYRGHVTLGVSIRSLMQYRLRITGISPFEETPVGNAGAVWLEPELVCIVESMPTDKESFRQAVFRGIRNDKTPLECQLRKDI